MIKELTDQYGPTMTLQETAKVLKTHPKSILNAISAGRFPIKTHKAGRRHLVKTADVAAFFEESAHA